MISYRLAQIIDEIVPYYSDENYVIERLKQLSGIYYQLSPDLLNLLTNLNTPNVVIDKCRNLSGKVSNEVRDFKDNTTTSEFFNLLRDLIEYTQQHVDQVSPSSINIKQYLEDVNTAYNNYIDSQTSRLALSLVLQSHRAYSAISTFRDTLLSVQNSLISEPPPTTEDQEVLTLYFSHASDFELLSRKLNSLLDAYKELCEVCGVSYNDHPLQIIKIETGSVFIKIAGAILPLKLLEKFILKTAEILYRRFVREGRIEAESEYRKELIEEINLRNALNEAGINTEEIDGRIHSAARKHTENLLTLMYGEPSVEINGVETAIGDLQEQQFLEQSKTRRIEHQQLNLPERGNTQNDEASSDAE